MQVLWIIPVSFVSSLSNLQAISRNGPFNFLEPVFEVSSVVTGLIEGYLPTIVLAVFMAVLPMILTGACVRLRGALLFRVEPM